MRWHAGIYVTVAGILVVADLMTRPAATRDFGGGRHVPFRVSITEVLVESGGGSVGATARGGRPPTARRRRNQCRRVGRRRAQHPAESVTADRERLAEFGLAAPPTRITFGRRDAAR
jgi:hypothetical protein